MIGISLADGVLDGWLGNLLVGLLVDGLFAWRTCRLVSHWDFFRALCSWLAGWLAGRLVEWLCCLWLAQQLSDWLLCLISSNCLHLPLAFLDLPTLLYLTSPVLLYIVYCALH